MIHPRPEARRDRWSSLDGCWEFAFDDADRGVVEGWWQRRLPRTIRVPFPYESRASGIGDRSFHAIVWYRRLVRIPSEWVGARIRLHFGAVDHTATVFFDGVPLGTHAGGHTPFSFDLAPPHTGPGEHVLAVRAVDTASLSQPRGKQWHESEPRYAFYPRTTGIWQPVWWEPLHERASVASIAIRCSLTTLEVDCVCDGDLDDLKLTATATLAGEATSASVDTPLVPPLSVRANHESSRTFAVSLSPRRPRLWTPETPHVYEIAVELAHAGETLDRVHSYSALRTVSSGEGRLLLNREPRYVRAVLDQGYWPDHLLAAPSSLALRRDVELAKAFGFDAVRKHNKAEAPLYHYWATQRGLMVFSELPPAYEFTAASVRALTAEWAEQVVRDRNYPCVIAWVPSNESTGFTELVGSAPRIAALNALYYLAHALDGSRPVVSNDGWEHAKTDLVTLHEYTQDPRRLRASLDRFFAAADGSAYGFESYDDEIAPDDRGKVACLAGYAYAGQPVLVSEYGGAAIGTVDPSHTGAWGYGRGVEDGSALLHRFESLTGALQNDARLAGSCYTQLYDVEQEVNGLADAYRRPKVEPRLVKAVNERRTR